MFSQLACRHKLTTTLNFQMPNLFMGNSTLVLCSQTFRLTAKKSRLLCLSWPSDCHVFLCHVWENVKCKADIRTITDWQAINT